MKPLLFLLLVFSLVKCTPTKVIQIPEEGGAIECIIQQWGNGDIKIAGATVVFKSKDYTRTVASGLNGRVKEKLPIGKYKVIIHAVGYKTYRMDNMVSMKNAETILGVGMKINSSRCY